MSVEQHGVRFTVTYLTDGMVGSHFLAARRINGRDFAPILKDAYVNYAEGKNSELLSLYNEYKEHQADRIRDFWDHPLFSEYIQSPLVGDNGHAYFTVFEVVVENHLNDKVRVQPFSAVLVDDSGIQVSALSKEDLFAELEQSWARLSLTSWALSTTSFSREYFLRSSSRVQRSNLSASTVFGRAQARGYIFFPRLENSVKGFTFILPDVTTLKSGIPDTTFDVEIDFSNR